MGITNIKLPVEIREDNQACIKTATSEILSNRTKHIDVRYFYVREQIQKKLQTLKYIRSEDNPADLFTKNLPRDQFIRLREAIGIVPLTDNFASGSVEIKPRD